MIMNCSLSFKRSYSFYKGLHLFVFRLDCFCLSQNMIHKICESEKKTNDFVYYYHCMCLLAKSFVLITFHKFGTDVLYRSELFTVNA